MNKYIQAKNNDLKDAIEFFKKDISSLRTGRANPSLLDGVMIDSYGVKTPIQNVASITVADGRSMTITPWDKSVLKEAEKGIVDANLGVGVVNEGDKLRISIPMMTEENRRELVKKLNEKMEKGRVSLRQARDDIKNSIEEAFKKKEVSEDDKFKFITELDEAIRDYNEQLKALRDGKEKDIMTI
ncbi:MAG: ribosome recycling factor [Patescibacteria group bacterium]|jgi:ribosome recycling factor